MRLQLLLLPVLLFAAACSAQSSQQLALATLFAKYAYSLHTILFMLPTTHTLFRSYSPSTHRACLQHSWRELGQQLGLDRVGKLLQLVRGDLRRVWKHHKGSPLPAAHSFARGVLSFNLIFSWSCRRTTLTGRSPTSLPSIASPRSLSATTAYTRPSLRCPCL